MGAFSWENPDGYIAFEWLLQGPEYEAEKDPNNRNLPMPTREPKVEAPRRTFEDRAQVWIAEGCCPVCKVDAPDGYCDICGWTLKSDKSVAAAGGGSAATEHLDEFAPATVSKDEVA